MSLLCIILFFSDGVAIATPHALDREAPSDVCTTILRYMILIPPLLPRHVTVGYLGSTKYSCTLCLLYACSCKK